MAESTKNRRRWPWAILAGLLLIVAASAAWPYRPLNQTERRLVGTWQEVRSPENRFRYFSNRRFCSFGVYGTGEIDVGAIGNWSCTTASLTYKTDRGLSWNWSSCLWSLRRFFQSETLDLRFEESDHVWIGGVELVRVPDQSIPPSLLNRKPPIASGSQDPTP